MNKNNLKSDEAWSAIIMANGPAAPLAAKAQEWGVSLNYLAEKLEKDHSVVARYFKSNAPHVRTLTSIAAALTFRRPGTVARALVDRLNERDEATIRRLAPRGLPRNLYAEYYLSIGVKLKSEDEFLRRLDKLGATAKEIGQSGPLASIRSAHQDLAVAIDSYPENIRECGRRIQQMGTLDDNRKYHELLDLLAGYIPLGVSEPVSPGQLAVADMLRDSSRWKSTRRSAPVRYPPQPSNQALLLHEHKKQRERKRRSVVE